MKTAKDITERSIEMITTHQIKTINYLVICINEFADRFAIDTKTAYRFLSKYGGISFLLEHYEIEHTLSLDEAIDDLVAICSLNGGVIQ